MEQGMANEFFTGQEALEALCSAGLTMADAAETLRLACASGDVFANGRHEYWNDQGSPKGSLSRKPVRQSFWLGVPSADEHGWGWEEFDCGGYRECNWPIGSFGYERYDEPGGLVTIGGLTIERWESVQFDRLDVEALQRSIASASSNTKPETQRKKITDDMIRAEIMRHRELKRPEIIENVREAFAGGVTRDEVGLMITSLGIKKRGRPPAI